MPSGQGEQGWQLQSCYFVASVTAFVQMMVGHSLLSVTNAAEAADFAVLLVMLYMHSVCAGAASSLR
jgi:hypothetical protein